MDAYYREKEEMTLKQILSLYEGKLRGNIKIEERLMAVGDDGVMRDLGYAGECMYENGVLTPLDGDSYSLTYEYDAHTIAHGRLIVWEDITNGLSVAYALSENPDLEGLFGAVDKHIRDIEGTAHAGV